MTSISVLKSTLMIMNHKNLDMTSHCEKGLGNCLMKSACRCSEIVFGSLMEYIDENTSNLIEILV